MLSITETRTVVTHKIQDETGKWVGNLVQAEDDSWTTAHYYPVVIDGAFYGQYAECDRTCDLTFHGISNALGHLQDSEAHHGVGLPAGRPIFPEGTPEYETYTAKLRTELAKFVAGEEPYGFANDSQVDDAVRNAQG